MATDLQTPVERLTARQGEILRAWGPLRLDPVTISRFEEAVGWPVQSMSDDAVSPAILLQLGNDPVDVHEDRRPLETIDEGLKNPVNGGTTVLWFRPLRPGDSIAGAVRIHNAYVREGKAGPLAFVVLETRFVDDAGGLVARAEKTIIFREVA